VLVLWFVVEDKVYVFWSGRNLGLMCEKESEGNSIILVCKSIPYNTGSCVGRVWLTSYLYLFPQLMARKRMLITVYSYFMLTFY
jgi:hypothetical protein